MSFELISSLYGPFTIDIFADNFNYKGKKSNSMYYCPEISHVNAFTANWIEEENWLCTPVSFIGSIIQHLKLRKAKRILLVPV